MEMEMTIGEVRKELGITEGEKLPVGKLIQFTRDNPGVRIVPERPKAPVAIRKTQQAAEAPGSVQHVRKVLIAAGEPVPRQGRLSVQWVTKFQELCPEITVDPSLVPGSVSKLESRIEALEELLRQSGIEIPAE
jgi:hypothetical protein